MTAPLPPDPTGSVLAALKADPNIDPAFKRRLQKNGGPAFPTRLHPDSYEGRGLGGMSLRDWFAGMALQGLYGGAEEFRRGGEDLSEDARLFYEIADAMLAARARGEQP